MNYALSPYDRDSGNFDINLSLAVFLSVAFHGVMFWMFFLVLPGLMPLPREPIDDFITVELLGSLAPAAPPAPDLKVDPNLKGPDVVEMTGEGPPPVPQPQVALPDPAAPPAKIIPLGPKSPEKPPEITPNTAPPPPVTAPRVVPDRPKGPSEAQILAQRRQEIRRKLEADRENQAIASRMANLATRLGQGTGEGSTRGGATGGERVHPDKARYYAQIRDIISSHWIPPINTLDAGLKTVYNVTVQPDGHVSASSLKTSSGNAEYDLSVQRAVSGSSPLPALPPIFEGQAQNLDLGFNLQDLMQMRQG